MKKNTLQLFLVSVFCIIGFTSSLAQGTFTASVNSGNTNLVMDNISATTIEVDRSFPGGQLAHSFTLSSGVWTGVDNGTVSGTGTATLTVTNTGFSNVTINDTGNNDPDISFIGAIAMTNSNFNLNGVGNVTNETLSFSLGFSRINWNVTSIDIVNAGILIKCGISAITATGDITLEEVNAFDSSQGNGCSVLSIDTPGITRLNDDITGFGGIGSLSIGGGGTTIINHLPSFPNSPSIAAFGSMTFEPGENVILENGARIQSLTAGIITYGGKVDGPFNLISQGGTTIFSEDVGATTLLNGFYSPSNTSTVIIQGEQFNTTTFQDFEGGVSLTNANPVSIQSGVSFNVEGQLSTARTTTITATNIFLRGNLFIGNNNMPGVTSLIGNSDFQIVTGGNQARQMRFHINSFGTAGTDYSKLNVNGTIDLANISLSLINSFFGTPPTTPITIIENDGIDPIEGTFNGLMEGATVTSNGENWTISYVGGTGNDVVLIPPPPPNVYVDTSGNLVIEDNDDKDDTIRIFRFGGSYRIVDTANELYAGSGTFQINPNTVQVDLSAITGSINVNLNGGDDTLILDYTAADIQDIVNYNGGAQNSTNPGDVLSVVSGTRIYDTIAHTLISENDGNISITNQGVINYVGLEPITDNLRGRNRIFNFTGGAETILLRNDATANMNFIDSTIGESITFRNPITSLTINAGSGNDIINLETLDTFFGSSITVNGDAGNDTYNQNSAITIQNTSSAFIVRTVETFSQTAALSTLGSITYNIASSVTLNDTNAGGNLNISSLGDVTAIGTTIAIGGTTSIDAVGLINISTALGNSFTGMVNLTAARVVDFATNAPIQFGMISLSDTSNVTSTVTNNGQTTAFTQNVTTAALHDFTIRSSGIVSQSSGSAITTDALTINALSANVILANAINDVNSLEVTNGGDVSFTDIDDINVLNTVSNTLNVTSGAALTSSGIKNINGAGISSLTSNGALTLTGTINQNAGILNLESPTAISLGHTHTSAASTTTNINGGTGTVSTAGVNLTFFDLSVNAGNYQTNGNTTTINGVATINDTASLIGIGTINGEVSIANGGEIAPGNSPGILNTENTIFQSNSTLAIEMNGFTTPGTDFDQLQVTGTVNLTGAVLNLIDGIVPNIPDNTEIVIIANDGTDAVIGEFISSNADGFNGQRLRVIYDGGDGNDVAIVVGIPNVEIVAGDLIIIDNEDRDDNITIIISGTNYLITDPINELIVGAGGTQVNANTISIPIALVTGTIEVQTMGGDDNFTTDFSGGNFSDVINFDGGNQNSTNPGDVLAITGGGTFATVEHTFINENDGNVMVTGNSSINYVGLEPVVDNLSVTDRVFNFTGGSETITLDDGGTLDNQIDSTLGESVDFNNPFNSLTINSGSGDDTINIEGVAAGFDADLTVNGDDAIDTVNFQTAGTNVTSGAILITTETANINENVTTTGTISVTADKRLLISSGAIIQSTDNDITMIGGNLPMPGDDFIGVIIFANSEVRTTGSGNISITGTAAFNFNSFRRGIQISSGGKVLTQGTGSIDLTGAGADGTANNEGVAVFGTNSRIESNGGGITINGTGGQGTGNFNTGVALYRDHLVQDLNGGNISITGTGQGTPTARGSRGIEFANPNVFTSTGDITLIGTGAIGANDFNQGIITSNPGTIQTVDGTISLQGTGNGFATSNIGVYAGADFQIIATGTGSIDMNGTGANGGSSFNGGTRFDSNTIVQTVDGSISITGNGGNGSGNDNMGLLTIGNVQITATGTGAIDLNGTSGQSGSFGRGVVLFNGANISANGGGITIDGDGLATSTGNDNWGVAVEANSNVIELGGGDITITGNGGNGTFNNHGVLVRGNSLVSSTNGNINLTGVSGDGTANTNIGILIENSSVTATGTGALAMNGTGGTGASNNEGIRFLGGPTTIQTNGGGMNLTGMGGAGTGIDNIGVFLLSGPTVEDIANGVIVINGTGGSGTHRNKGIVLFPSTSTIRTNGGGMTLTGNGSTTATGFDNFGVSNEGGTIIDTADGMLTIIGTGGSGTTNNNGVVHRGDGLIESTGAGGNVSITGTAATISDIGVHIETFNSLINAGDNISVTALTGPFVTPSGLPVVSQLTGTSITLNGDFRAGENIDEGQLLVTGDTALSAGDVFSVSVNDFNAAGTDYDQVAVTGTVDITGSTLTLVDNTAEIGELCDQLTIIDNDGTDAVVGEFAGLPEATDITFNGELWRINYAAGDGNDVVLAFNPGFVAAPICQAFTASLDANGEVSITAADVDGGTPMGCDFDSLAIDIMDFTCADLGDNDVVLTVTDIFGNMNSCTAVVTVVDTIAPIVGCPADIVVSTDADSCMAMVTFANPAVIENCGVFTITQTVGAPSGSLFAVGVNNIGFSVEDGSGNVTTCSFTITVEDDFAPVAVCQNITVQLDDTGNVSITAAQINNGSTDNCNIMMSTLDITDFDCGDIGDNTVILTVTDNAGNTDTCMATVTVEDNVAPMVVCQDITVELGADGTITLDASLLDGGSSDACGIDSFSASPATLDCSNIGSNTVTLTVTDVNGNTSTCEAMVEVEDNMAPILVCQPAVIELGADGTATVDPTVFVDMTNPVDNCDSITYTIDVTMVDCDDVGTTIDVTVFADDGNGNFASCMTTMTVEDVTGPIFDASTLPQGPITRFINPDTGIYRMEDFRTGIVVTDDCSFGLLPIVLSQDPPAGSPLDVGVYDVTISAVDDAGNMSDYVFELRVEAALTTDDVTLSTLVLYPNPMRETVILSNPNSLDLQTVAIYDLQSRLIQQIDLSDMLSEKVIDISSLQAASYVFVITGDSGSITKTMIKE